MPLDDARPSNETGELYPSPGSIDLGPPRYAVRSGSWMEGETEMPPHPGNEEKGDEFPFPSVRQTFPRRGYYYGESGERSIKRRKGDSGCEQIFYDGRAMKIENVAEVGLPALGFELSMLRHSRSLGLVSDLHGFNRSNRLRD